MANTTPMRARLRGNPFQLALPSNAKKEKSQMSGMSQPQLRPTTESTTPMRARLKESLSQLALPMNARKVQLLINILFQLKKISNYNQANFLKSTRILFQHAPHSDAKLNQL
jgi:hypothetical protein